MSQSSQRATPASTSFALIKFSKATDPESQTQFGWVHYMNNDICVLFDPYGFNGSNSLVMKVTQGAQVLELVDLSEKVESTKSAIADARRLRIELRRAQYPFSALYRRMNSVIALQYRAPDHMIRRIQLRFTSIQDFDTALAILQRLGCPLYNSTAEVNFTFRPSTADPQIPTPASAIHCRNTDQNPLHIPTYRSSASAIQSRPQTAFDPRSITYPATLHTDDRLLSSASSLFPPQNHLYRSFSSPFAIAPTQAPPFRPSPGLFPIDENATSINTDPMPQTARYESPLNPLLSYPIGMARSNPVVPCTNMTPTTSKYVGNFLPPKALLNKPNEPVTSADQSAAPVSQLVQFENDLAEMNRLIPPRREYSFGRKGTTSKSTAGPQSGEGLSSRPSTGAQHQTVSSRPSTGVPTPSGSSHDSSRPSSALPPLPQPTFAGSDGLRDQANAITSSTNGQSATKQTVRPSISAGTTQMRLIAPKRTQLKKNAARPSTAVAKVSARTPNSSPTSCKRASTAVHADADTITPDYHTLDAFHTAPNSKSVQPNNPDEKLRYSLSKAADTFPASSVTVQVNGTANLANYAILPLEERIRVIENMLIAAVEDENFIKLCQDVNGCWQRIGIDNLTNES